MKVLSIALFAFLQVLSAFQVAQGVQDADVFKFAIKGDLVHRQLKKGRKTSGGKTKKTKTKKTKTKKTKIKKSKSKSKSPVASPFKTPFKSPVASPFKTPFKSPVAPPIKRPSSAPSSAPSNAPSSAPSQAPSSAPSKAPSSAPSSAPSNAPTGAAINVCNYDPEWTTNSDEWLPNDGRTITIPLNVNSLSTFLVRWEMYSSADEMQILCNDSLLFTTGNVVDGGEKVVTGNTCEVVELKMISPPDSGWDVFASCTLPSPSSAPSNAPSSAPSNAPSSAPSQAPSSAPSNAPSSAPT